MFAKQLADFVLSKENSVLFAFCNLRSSIIEVHGNSAMMCHTVTLNKFLKHVIIQVEIQKKGPKTMIAHVITMQFTQNQNNFWTKCQKSVVVRGTAGGDTRQTG